MPPNTNFYVTAINGSDRSPVRHAIVKYGDEESKVAWLKHWIGSAVTTRIYIEFCTAFSTVYPFVLRWRICSTFDEYRVRETMHIHACYAVHLPPMKEANQMGPYMGPINDI